MIHGDHSFPPVAGLQVDLIRQVVRAVRGVAGVDDDVEVEIPFLGVGGKILEVHAEVEPAVPAAADIAAVVGIERHDIAGGVISVIGHVDVAQLVVPAVAFVLVDDKTVVRRPIGELLVRCPEARELAERVAGSYSDRPLGRRGARVKLAGVGPVLVLQRVDIRIRHPALHDLIAVGIAAGAVRGVAVAGRRSAQAVGAVVERVQGVLRFPPIRQAVAVRIGIQRVGLGPCLAGVVHAVGIGVAFDPVVEVGVFAVPVAGEIVVRVGIVRIRLGPRRAEGLRGPATAVALALAWVQRAAVAVDPPVAVRVLDAVRDPVVVAVGVVGVGGRARDQFGARVVEHVVRHVGVVGGVVERRVDVADKVPPPVPVRVHVRVGLARVDRRSQAALQPVRQAVSVRVRPERVGLAVDVPDVHGAVAPCLGVRAGQVGGRRLVQVQQAVLIVVGVVRAGRDVLAKDHGRVARGTRLDRVRVAVRVHVRDEGEVSFRHVRPQEAPVLLAARGRRVRQNAVRGQARGRRPGIGRGQEQAVARHDLRNDHEVRVDLDQVSGAELGVEERAGPRDRAGSLDHGHRAGEQVGRRRDLQRVPDAVRERKPEVLRGEVGLHKNAVLPLRRARAGHVGQNDLVRLAVGIHLRRIDDLHEDARGAGLGLHVAARLSRHAASAVAAAARFQREHDQVLEVRVPVVHVGHVELDLPHSASRIACDGVRGAALRGPVDRDQEVLAHRRIIAVVHQRRAEFHAHRPPRRHHRPVRGGPVICKDRRRGTAGHGPLERREMLRRIRSVKVRRGADFEQLDADRRRAAGRDVEIREAPFLRVRARDAQRGSHRVGLGPGGPAQQVRAVAVGVGGRRIVVREVRVADVVPDLFHGRVRAHDHAVLALIQRVAVGGVLHFPCRRGGIEVERLDERVVDGGLAGAVEERACADHVEALDEPGRRQAEVVVRPVGNRLRVEEVGRPHPHHLHLACDICAGIRDDAVPRGAADAGLVLAGSDLVTQRCVVAERSDRARVPVHGAVVVSERHLLDLRISRAPAAGALRPGRAVRRVIEKDVVDLVLVAQLDPHRDIGTRGVLRLGVELQRGGVVRVLRHVVNPRGRFRAVPIVGGAAEIRGVPGGANRAEVGLRPGRPNLVSHGIDRGELLLVLAVIESRLLVAKEHVGGSFVPRRVVARIARRVRVRVQVDPAVELHQHVDGGTIHARHEFQVRGHGHAGQAVGVRVIGRVRIRHAVWIERRIAVRPVAADDGDGRNQLAVLVKADRLPTGILPQVGFLRTARREREVAARRNDHRADRRRVRIEAAAVGGVVVEVLVVHHRRVAERRRETARLAGLVVVVHHDQQYRPVRVAHAPVLALVAPFVDDHVGIGPLRDMGGAGKAVMDADQVRDATIAPLPEISRVRVSRECPAALAERLRVPVAVGVNHRETAAGQIHRVVQLLVVGDIVVVALGVVHPEVLPHLLAGNVVGAVQARQAAPRVPEVVVERLVRARVDQPHAGRPVLVVRRRLAHVLAEHHQVVAAVGLLRVEHGIAMIVPIDEAAGHVELPLGHAAIPRRAGILAAGILLSEEIRRHVLHRVEPQAVHLGLVHQPANGPHQVAADVFFEGIRILGDRVGGDARVAESAVARWPVVVILGIVRVTDERDFGVRASLRRTEVAVGRLVRDVNQVGQVLVLHLPRVAPVLRVVPFPVEPLLGHAQVEILGQHAGIDVDRRVGVVAWNVERPVIHDVVEVHAHAEPMRRLDQTKKLFFRSIPGLDRASLVLAAEIEGVPEIVTHRRPAAALLRRRQPKRRVTDFGQLRNLLGNLFPGVVEELEQNLGTSPARKEQQREKCRGESLQHVSAFHWIVLRLQAVSTAHLNTLHRDILQVKRFTFNNSHVLNTLSCGGG